MINSCGKVVEVALASDKTLVSVFLLIFSGQDFHHIINYYYEYQFPFLLLFFPELGEQHRLTVINQSLLSCICYLFIYLFIIK